MTAKLWKAGFDATAVDYHHNRHEPRVRGDGVKVPILSADLCTKEAQQMVKRLVSKVGSSPGLDCTPIGNVQKNEDCKEEAWEGAARRSQKG